MKYLSDAELPTNPWIRPMVNAMVFLIWKLGLVVSVATTATGAVG
jgi:hypothetical protein